jgi:hypothetical protein
VEIGATVTAAHVPVWLEYFTVAEWRERAELALNRLEAIETSNVDLRIRILLGLGIAVTMTVGPIEGPPAAAGEMSHA